MSQVQISPDSGARAILTFVYKSWAHLFWALKLRMKSQPTKKSQEVLGQNSIILSEPYHGKPPSSSDF